MDTTNLADLYDVPPIDWEEITARLDRGFPMAPGSGDDSGRHTCWLTSLNADGSPHTNALGAVWESGDFWFESGLSTRRGRNLTRDPRCTLALSVREFDVVVEGRAELVTDPATVARLAQHYATEEGWPCEVDASGTALTAPFSAQSAGSPPWHLFRIEPTSAHVVQCVEPYGATRWRF